MTLAFRHQSERRALTIAALPDTLGNAVHAGELTMPSPQNRERDASREVWFHAAVFLIAFLILFSRRPDAILNAQFYAEDGKYWYADAYQYGWRCLLMPLGGYLNTISRLIGLFTLLFPLTAAPLVMNLCGIVTQILPIHIFLSSRLNAIPFATRLVGSFLYLALPNSFELHANTTNLHWHLALSGCLLLLGRPDNRLAWRIFDSLLLASVALAGPFGILLIPMALALRLIKNDARYNLPIAVLIPPALLQICMILFFSGAQRPAILGASLARLTGILGGQLFLSSVLGVRTFIQLFFSQMHGLFLIQAIASVIGLAFLIYACWRGPIELKLFILFSAAVLALGLARPMAAEPQRLQWEVLQVPGCGNRYYFFPMLAFLASLVWMLSASISRPTLVRWSAFVVLALLPVGVCRDWRYREFADLHFREFAAEFERAAPGTQFIVGINPGLNMQLTKR
jgi:hypothetical protein